MSKIGYWKFVYYKSAFNADCKSVRVRATYLNRNRTDAKALYDEITKILPLSQDERIIQKNLQIIYDKMYYEDFIKENEEGELTI